MANIFTNFLSRIFGRKKTEPMNSSSQLIALNPFGSGTNAKAEENATFSSCVTFYGNVISKLFPILSRKKEKAEDFPNLNFLLEYQPNYIQNGVNFWKQVAVSYYSLNVAVIYIDRDFKESKLDKQVKNLWLIDVTDANFQMYWSPNDSDQKKLFFKFNINGVEMTASHEELIILSRTPSVANPFINAYDPIKRTIDVVNKNFDGIEKAVLNANVIRFLATADNVMNADVLAARQKQLNDRLAQVTNNGAFYVDGAQQVVPIPSTPSYQGNDLVRPLEESIYRYFGLNSKIIDGSGSDDEYNNLCETQIEPFTFELAQALTLKILSREAIAKGTKIIIDTNLLFTTSHQHRIQQAQVLITSGKYKPNEIRDLIGVEPLPEDDNEFINRIDRIDTSESEKSQVDKNEETIK